MNLGVRPCRQTDGRIPAKAFTALLFKLPEPVSLSVRCRWWDLPHGLRNLNEITAVTGPVPAWCMVGALFMSPETLLLGIQTPVISFSPGQEKPKPDRQLLSPSSVFFLVFSLMDATAGFQQL